MFVGGVGPINARLGSRLKDWWLFTPDFACLLLPPCLLCTDRMDKVWVWVWVRVLAARQDKTLGVISRGRTCETST